MAVVTEASPATVARKTSAPVSVAAHVEKPAKLPVVPGAASPSLTSTTGAAAGVACRTSAAPPAESLESALLARDLEFAYLDLTRTTESFVMSGTEHGVPIEAAWGSVFDGVVYLKEMTGLANDGIALCGGDGPTKVTAKHSPHEG